MPVVKEREYRSIPMPGTEGDGFVVEGYATTFDDPYVMYSFDGIDYKEVIDRNALDGADLSDVIFQYNHEGMVYARQSNGTLELSVDGHGIRVRADLSKTQDSRNMFENISSGNVREMSWAFTVAEEEYDAPTHTRRITKIRKVYDVSAVSEPANPSTYISARSYFAGVAEREKQERLAEETRQHEREAAKKKLSLMLELNK